MGLNAHEIIRRAFLDACREHGLDPCVLLPEPDRLTPTERHARELLSPGRHLSVVVSHSQQ